MRNRENMAFFATNGKLGSYGPIAGKPTLVNSVVLTLGKQSVMQAARFLRGFYNKKKPMDRNLDKETEEMIKNKLVTAFPDFSFYGEETGHYNGTSDYSWYCDPISSTKNFEGNLPHFAVSLALFKGTTPLMGIVSDPITRELFFAISGQGAFCGRTPLIPSGKVGLEDSTFIASYDKNTEFCQKLLLSKAKMRMYGSWAIHFCYVAAGKTDIAYCLVKDIYGVAAGLIIAQEAGCLIVDERGLPWSMNSKQILVCANQYLFDLSKNILGP